MQRILGEIHYMPDHWKQRPHSVEVYTEFTHVFQFTVVREMYKLCSVVPPATIPSFSMLHIFQFSACNIEKNWKLGLEISLREN